MIAVQPFSRRHDGSFDGLRPLVQQSPGSFESRYRKALKETITYRGEHCTRLQMPALTLQNVRQTLSLRIAPNKAPAARAPASSISPHRRLRRGIQETSQQQIDREMTKGRGAQVGAQSDHVPSGRPGTGRPLAEAARRLQRGRPDNFAGRRSSNRQSPEIEGRDRVRSPRIGARSRALHSLPPCGPQTARDRRLPAADNRNPRISALS